MFNGNSILARLQRSVAEKKSMVTRFGRCEGVWAGVYVVGREGLLFTPRGPNSSKQDMKKIATRKEGKKRTCGKRE